MRGQKIGLNLGAPLAKPLINHQGITRLLYLTGRGHHAFASEQRGNLRLAESVALYGQGPLDGAELFKRRNRRSPSCPVNALLRPTTSLI